MDFDPQCTDNLPERQDDAKQAAYVAHRAIVRAMTVEHEAARKARQEMIETEKAAAQIPDAD